MRIWLLLYISEVTVTIKQLSFSDNTTIPRRTTTTRRKSCMSCSACTRNDCGLCINCKDKVKFGGQGRRKQRCIHRVCIHKEESKMLFKGKQTIAIKQYILCIFVTAYRKIRHNTASTNMIFFCTYRVVGI